jgi:hypothetical protein
LYIFILAKTNVPCNPAEPIDNQCSRTQKCIEYIDIECIFTSCSDRRGICVNNQVAESHEMIYDDESN